MQLKEKHQKRLKDIRRRNEDMYRSSGREIEGGKFASVSMKVFEEQRFLLAVIDFFVRQQPLEEQIPEPEPEPEAEPVASKNELDEDE